MDTYEEFIYLAFFCLIVKWKRIFIFERLVFDIQKSCYLVYIIYHITFIKAS